MGGLIWVIFSGLGGSRYRRRRGHIRRLGNLAGVRRELRKQPSRGRFARRLQRVNPFHARPFLALIVDLICDRDRAFAPLDLCG